MRTPAATTALPHRPASDDNWRTEASCANDEQPDRWVDLPDIRVRGKNNPAYDTHVEELSKTCQTCPVFDQCLWSALDMDVRGIFAGTDEYDRADIRDQNDLVAPPRIPAPENDEDARVLEQSFTALRLARRGLSNIEIAEALEVSTMTVSRLTSSEDAPAQRRGKYAEHSSETANDFTDMWASLAVSPYSLPNPDAASATSANFGVNQTGSDFAEFDQFPVLGGVS
jgi:hypothetical protein